MALARSRAAFTGRSALPLPHPSLAAWPAPPSAHSMTPVPARGEAPPRTFTRHGADDAALIVCPPAPEPPLEPGTLTAPGSTSTHASTHLAQHPVHVQTQMQCRTCNCSYPHRRDQPRSRPLPPSRPPVCCHTCSHLPPRLVGDCRSGRRLPTSTQRAAVKKKHSIPSCGAQASYQADVVRP